MTENVNFEQAKLLFSKIYESLLTRGQTIAEYIQADIDYGMGDMTQNQIETFNNVKNDPILLGVKNLLETRFSFDKLASTGEFYTNANPPTHVAAQYGWHMSYATPDWFGYRSIIGMQIQKMGLEAYREEFGANVCDKKQEFLIEQQPLVAIDALTKSYERDLVPEGALQMDNSQLFEAMASGSFDEVAKLWAIEQREFLKELGPMQSQAAQVAAEEQN
ncbi:MAG: hypothetical protein IJD48_02485 [Clostridia bacterium]|nr:hypothetical protein [Clostridia bacterium]